MVYKWISKRLNIILKVFIIHLIYYPTPSILTYVWGFGSIGIIILCIQICSGLLLVCYYKADACFSFGIIENLIHHIKLGDILRYIHSSGASIFFLMIYLHIGRGVYYGSFMNIRNFIWLSGVLAYLLIITIGFLGYVLPWGQISFWGATVITNLIASIPYLGNRILIWVLGDHTLTDVAIRRFFILHYLLPFLLLIIVVVHLKLLHLIGSNNPFGLPKGSNLDHIYFYAFYWIKDSFGFIVIFNGLIWLIFLTPHFVIDSNNFEFASNIKTPAHIVPEWYFLPFYAILRSVPYKGIGINLIIAAIAILCYYLTYLVWINYTAEIKIKKSISTIPISAFFFWVFSLNFIFLAYLGHQIVEEPFTSFSLISTYFYYFYWLGAPFLYIFEYKLYFDIGENSKHNVSDI